MAMPGLYQLAKAETSGTLTEQVKRVHDAANAKEQVTAAGGGQTQTQHGSVQVHW